MSDSATPLQTQGRWAWRSLPLLALLLAVFLWQTSHEIADAELAARKSLLHQRAAWSLVQTLTGTTLGR